MTQDLARDLAAIDHFSALDPDAMKDLVDGSELARYGTDETILDPARPRAAYSFLVEGRWCMRRDMVGVSKPFEWDDDRPGNWHGGVGLFDAVAPVTVRAVEPCTVLHVPRDLLERLMRADAHLALAMLRGAQGGATVLYRHATEGDAPNRPDGPAKGITR